MPILATLAGISAHLLVFRIGDWDVASLYIFLGHVLAFSVAGFFSFTQYQVSVPDIMAHVGGYVFGLYISMLIYRAYFHRLHSYPGPFLAKLTNFYITALSVRKLQLFKVVQNLHAQHGDYVRLGPSELSIADPAAVQALYGTASPTTKGPWYTLLEPRTPLFMARDKREHARRRKVWDQGFSTKALTGYDHRITKAIKELLHVIDRDHQQPINITKWFNFFVFDVMEDLAFNKNSTMLRDGEEKYIFKTIRADMFNIAFFAHLPWLLPFLKRTPILNMKYLQFWDWIQRQIDERIKSEPEQPDIFSWLLAEYSKSDKTQLDRWNLHGDAQLIVVAGTDSVAATLTHTFFELACDAGLMERVQKELDALPSLAHDNLIKVDLLDAVINETLRLHPPVPSGTQRVTPPEGLQIGDKHIPGDTIVQVPSYTIFRDARAFEKPTEFIPERWTTRPDLIKDKSAFIPFNIGPYGCVGKRLAMMEIRRVVAEILSRYNLSLAPSQGKEAFLNGKQDTFTVVSAPLFLQFSRRE
ncbi:hypothetical protein QQS21_000178 [Conoideocrella luteorostrata]|uniref:Cytochrome P450 n=1 Tax=Conoideocrella luteorostrata TaxID=1105319 RepID=A0AAJ0CZ79_9HYPO|nr:hypothetical protein QQS21_000178 [Conoideocrella luteorostrata]